MQEYRGAVHAEGGIDQDVSVELDALWTLGERGNRDPVVVQKILDDSPRVLYGL